MPELPEVEITKNELKKILLNKHVDEILINTNSLRIPIKKREIKQLERLKVIHISRRGKYILITFSNNYILLIHLGMSGRIVFKKKPFIINKHDHFALVINKKFFIILNDPRKFGLVDVCYKEDLFNCYHLKYLGIEPLTNGFSFQYLKKILSNRKSNIKNLLLNQRLISGLGNIYVCESLYESNISPFKIAKNLNKKQISSLCLNIKKILKIAIKSNGSSISDFKLPSGLLGNFQNKFKVYNREGKKCKNIKCKGKITKTTIGGRPTYYCCNCQKM